MRVPTAAATVAVSAISAVARTTSSASAASAPGPQQVTGNGDPDTIILNVPFRTQFDNSPYQNSDCGPASLAMVLAAYGVNVPTDQLRTLANQLQGTTAFDDGVALDYLQTIAQEAGLRTEGLRATDGKYQQWTMGDLIRDVRSGYPVITLVHYNALPGHTTSTSSTDHYIVIVGMTSQGFVINDPAYVGDGGERLLLLPDQLMNAWRTASIPEQAVAFLPPSGQGGLTLVGGPSTQTPGPSLPAGQGAGQPAPGGAIRTASTASESLGPSSPITSPLLPPTVSGASVTAAPNAGLGPPPDATFAAWAVGMSEWRHAGDPTLAPTTAIVDSSKAAQSAVGGSPSAPASPILPVLVVIGLVGGLAVVIVKGSGSGLA